MPGRTAPTSWINWSDDRRVTDIPSRREPVIETDALIIGAGPVGLFQAFELGLLEIGCHIVDALEAPGGQCAELYGDKPIYDIPAVLECTGRGLVERLLRQVAPFSPGMHLGQEVAAVQRQPDGRFLVETGAGRRFLARTVFIAAGVGAFRPRELKVDGAQRHVGSQIFHRPSDLASVAGKHVVIVGDGDDALGWATTLADATADATTVASTVATTVATTVASTAALTDATTDGTPDAPTHTRGARAEAPASVTLVHRREQFVAAPERVAKMRAACAAGRMRFIAGQIAGLVEADARLTGLEVIGPDGRLQPIAVDRLHAFLGLSPKLGPIADWGLALERKQLVVDTEKFQTSEPGVFAVGDINTYPGKRKLIVCGFHEATLAAFGACAHLFPDRPVHLQYTTTSPRLHALLGVR